MQQDDALEAIGSFKLQGTPDDAYGRSYDEIHTDAEVMEAIRAFQGPILLDLDETLYLRNSSQDFLASAQPRFFCGIILRILEKLKPWRFTGAETADVWRTFFVSLFMPWVWLTWRHEGVRLGQIHANKLLIDAANSSNGKLYVATLGFGPIVRPIVDGLGLNASDIISCRLFSFSDRRSGKLALVRNSLSEDRIRNALVVTDSRDDQDLLEASGRPFLKRWPGARFVSASSLICLPFEYLSKIKRPGAKYGWLILKEDFLSCWLIALFPYIVSEPAMSLPAFFLFVSFWSVYELGYYENDIIAGRESDGVRSKNFDPERLSNLPGLFYFYGILFSLVGFSLLGVDAATAIKWSAVLVCVRLNYWVFNRIDKKTRIWLYFPLQLLRMFAISVVFPFNPEGVALCLSYAIARWLSYIAYREIMVENAYQWPSLKVPVVWLVLDVALNSVFFALDGLPDGLHALQAFLGVLLISARARVTLKEIFRGVHWI